jgi:hypothetical protein
VCALTPFKDVGHLDWFYTNNLVIVNSVTINIGTLVSLLYADFDFDSFSICPGIMEWQDHMAVLFLVF